MINLDFDTKIKMESLTALFEHATEGIIISDSRGKIIKANPSSVRLFGYQDNELLSKVIEDLIPTRFKKNHEGHRKHYSESPHARSMGKNSDLYAIRKDGSEFPVEISLSYYKKEDELFVIAFIIDNTERKKQEENIKKLNQDLEKKVMERTQVLQEALYEIEKSKEQLSQALENEKELNDMKSRFVSMASHEFRTPLSTILSSISLISRYNEKDEKVSKHVQRVKSAVTNMTLILNDFLSAEKLEEGKTRATLEEFDLNSLASEITGELNTILKHGQIINFSYEGFRIVNSDKQMLRNMFLNMMSNAIKFSPENKNIGLKIISTESEIIIEVKDEGIGIPEEEQQYLFDRFFRARNATNIQGTGLGLNIVAKYVQLLEGNISFISSLVSGTKFTIVLPKKIIYNL